MLQVAIFQTAFAAAVGFLVMEVDLVPSVTSRLLPNSLSGSSSTDPAGVNTILCSSAGRPHFDSPCISDQRQLSFGNAPRALSLAPGR